MLLNLLIISTFLIEIAVLLYLEKKIWKTLYTPLLFLLLPYTLILGLTILISGRMGFVELYYPSIMIWCIGLLLFSIPSFVLGLFFAKSLHNGATVSLENEKFPIPLVIISALVVLLFAVHFRSILGSSQGFVGSDEFSGDFSGHGFWAHLHVSTLPILILAIYFVSKKNWWLWFVIIGLMLIGVINQVKGWIIIPIVAGLSMRIYFKKTHLSLRLVLSMLIFGFLVFLVSYMVLPLLGKADGKVTSELFDFVVGHFFHYMTSGVLGLSMDMEHGFPDRGDFDTLIAPLLNICNVVVGNEDMVSPVNPLYYHTGLNLTNVRTFFGTVFIYTNWFSFSVYILLVSAVMYFLYIFVRKLANLYLYVLYFFECSLLCMGWFEFYFFHLTVFEFPIWTLIFMCVVHLFKRYNKSVIQVEP